MEEFLVELLREVFEAVDFTAAIAAYLNHKVWSDLQGRFKPLFKKPGRIGTVLSIWVMVWGGFCCMWRSRVGLVDVPVFRAAGMGHSSGWIWLFLAVSRYLFMGFRDRGRTSPV